MISELKMRSNSFSGARETRNTRCWCGQSCNRVGEGGRAATVNAAASSAAADFDRCTIQSVLQNYGRAPYI